MYMFGYQLGSPLFVGYYSQLIQPELLQKQEINESARILRAIRLPIDYLDSGFGEEKEKEKVKRSNRLGTIGSLNHFPFHFSH